MLSIAHINYELHESQNSLAKEEPGEMATGPNLSMIWQRKDVRFIWSFGPARSTVQNLSLSV